MKRRVIGDERGIATVWAVGAIAAMVALAGLAGHLAAAALTRHRADGAADLAALASAAYAPWGADYACGQASWVAKQMNVSLTECRLVGLEAFVSVAARPPGVLAGFGTATAHARAGPVPPDEPAALSGETR